MKLDYVEKAREFLDANIMLFESECYFHPKINEKSHKLVRNRSATVFEDLYLKSKIQQANLEVKTK
jgi:hypothetical protein